MGSNVVEPSGFILNTYMRGIQQRTYYQIPTHLVMLAAWFRVFGFKRFLHACVFDLVGRGIAIGALLYLVPPLSQRAGCTTRCPFDLG